MFELLLQPKKPGSGGGFIYRPSRTSLPLVKDKLNAVIMLFTRFSVNVKLIIVLISNQVNLS